MRNEWAWFVAITVGLHVLVGVLASCGSDRAVDDLGPAGEAKLCADISGEEHHCLDRATGFEIRYEVEEDVCENEALPRYEDCGLTTSDVRGCIDAIDECDFEDKPRCTTKRGDELLDCIMPECTEMFSCELSANNDQDMGTTDAGAEDADSGNGSGEFTADFIAVTEILKANCLGCHQTEGEVFVVPTGALATPGDIQAVLSTSVTTSSGRVLVSPGQPSESELYWQIEHEGSIEQTQIDTIEQWITNGAQYTQ